MVLGRVVGTVVASRKEPKADGWKLLLVQPLDEEGRDAGVPVVAVDAVGAGVREVVLLAAGSSARQTGVTDQRPCDAVVMGIVDSWDVMDRICYRKGDDG